MMLQPVHGERALEVVHRGEKHIVLADLHIGIEDELASRGVRVPDQTERALERALALVGRTRPGALILLGDVRHRVPLAGAGERGRVERFFKSLSSELGEKVRIVVVRGNHDAGLRNMVPRSVGVVPWVRLGPCGLLHGHTWPPPELRTCATLVVGHSHPSVLLADERGRAIVEPCWLRARPTAAGRLRYPRLSRVVVMPAFNDIRSGAPVNVKGALLLGPLFRSGAVDLAGAEVHLPDGASLGRVRELEAPVGRSRTGGGD
ncbi:MAG: metallophosphoesterase [Thermoplasmatota archaeon]